MKIKWFDYLIAVQALIATFGSLYYGRYGDPTLNFVSGDLFNSMNGLDPCELCWFARICMYPLVIVSLLGIAYRSKNYILNIIPFLIIGIPLEIYHYTLQKQPIANGFTCTMANPCNALEVNYFGFLTIPLLCLIAFIVIGICCYLRRRENTK